MVSIQRNSDGTLTDVSDQRAPVPHSLTKIAKKTGNYGLADEAREQYKELALKEGEVPSAVFSRLAINSTGKNTKTIMISNGRGRGRIFEVAAPKQRPANTFGGIGLVNEEADGSQAGSKVAMDSNRDAAEFNISGYQNVAELFCEGVHEDNADDVGVFTDFNRTDSLTYLVQQVETEKPSNSATSMVDEKINESTREDDSETETETTMTNDSESVVEGPSQSSSAIAKPKGGNGKANGYCMFLKHIARQTGVTGPISELMRKFDKDWKALPDTEKADWKYRAKTGKSAISTGSRSSTRRTREHTPQMSSDDQVRRYNDCDYDDGY